MKLKKNCFIIIFFLSLGVCYGQPISIEAGINTGIKNYTSGNKKAITAFSNNKLYFVNFEADLLSGIIDRKDSSITIYSFNSLNKKTDSLILSMRDYSMKDDFSSGWFINFFISLNEKYIFINNNNCIIVFKKGNKKKYAMYKRIKTKYYYDNIKQIDNENFLFSFCYNSHPLDQKEKVVFSKYNINHDSVSKSIFPSYNGIEFTHLINNWVEVINRKIVFSNTLDYKLRLYDESLTLVDSISRNIVNWIVLNQDSSTSINSNLKQHIENLYELDQRIYRIEKIIPMGKSNLIVSYKIGEGKNARQIDIWNLKNGKLILIDSNIKVSTKELYLTNDSIISNSRPFPELIYSNDVYSSNKNLYVITDNYCPFITGNTYSQMLKICNLYYKEKGRNWGINVFKYNR